MNNKQQKKVKSLNIKYHSGYSQFTTIQGFTLIEFLVASMLAMIVIVAASSTYLITRRLNTTVQERINIQQNIRNAASQIARDARMAGNFGCFSTGSTVSTVINGFNTIESSHSDLVMLNKDKIDGYGVRLIPKTNLESAGLKGLQKPTDGLLFVYGQSANAITNLTDFEMGINAIADGTDSLLQTLINKGDVIISSCHRLFQVIPSDFKSETDTKAKITAVIPSTTTSNVKYSAKEFSMENGELTVSKLSASLYVLGDISQGTNWNGEQALLRYDLGSDGKWGNPQLLSTGIKSIKYRFAYVANDKDGNTTCPAGVSVSGSDEKFIFVNSPSALETKYSNIQRKTPPALAQIQLEYFNNKVSDVNEGDANTMTYIINANVRSGNSCANRQPSS